MIEFLHKAERPADRCMYPSKQCSKKRAHKLNGQLHKLCEEHRQQANRNQKRLQQRRRMRQFHQLQVYVLDTFAQGPEPDDEAYDANAYGGRLEPSGFISENETPNVSRETFWAVFHDDDQSDDALAFNVEDVAPLMSDDNESMRVFTPEDIYILHALLF